MSYDEIVLRIALRDCLPLTAHGIMMYYLNYLPLVSFSFCAAISIAVFLRRKWNLMALAFSLGMWSLAVMELFNFMALRAFEPDKILLWKRLSLLGEMLFVGNLFLFSLVFAKKDDKAAIKKWRWALPFAYVLPGVLLILLFTVNQSMATVENHQIIRIGDISKYFHIMMLIVVIATLMNLENTFRSSSGSERSRLIYIIFGTGAVLLFYVYLLSHRLLYNMVDINNIPLFSAVIIVGNSLISYSIIRNKIVDGDFYISRKVIFSSVSLIGIGLYSVVIALIAQLLKSFDIQKNFKVDVLLVFLAALVMILLFYNESFRRRTKAIINKNFRKSKYVYHDEWMMFSAELSKKINTQDICESFLNTLTDRLFVKYTSLWIMEDGANTLRLAALRDLKKRAPRIALDKKTMRWLFLRNYPVSKSEILSNKDLYPIGDETLEFMDITKAELLVPLILAQNWVGLLTLGKIRTGEPFNETDDFDLLKSATAHAASALNNARLFEEKMVADEMEAFHRFSSFVIHDLKNTTSTLSMITENAKKHMSNPEFQKDALRTISCAVEKMQKIIGNISNLPDRLELHLQNCDFNALIEEALEGTPINGSGLVKIDKKLCPLPQIRADVEEIYKVVHNLLMNSYEALDGNGCIKLNTQTNDKHVVLTVTDDGPGMSRKFIESSLFQPFKSTKKMGLGIGLYQCKTIIEAHGGEVEVQSRCGEGTTFSVYLPIAQSARVAVGDQRSAFKNQ